MFGLPANYLAIRKIADKYKLYILEDSAQGCGEIHGKRACSFGDIATTSFFLAKPLGCYGDGGAVSTDNDEWATLLDSYRVHGKGSSNMTMYVSGVNSRLDTLQAAILIPKFNAFKEYEVTDINKAAALYTEKLKGVVNANYSGSHYSSWAQYTITLENKEQRDALQNYLKEQGIPTMVYYPKPMHEQTTYKELNYLKGSCPVT